MRPDPLTRDAAGLHEVLARRAARTPDALAFAYLDDELAVQERVTYAELHRRVRAVAAAVRTRLPAGAHVLLLLPPGIDHVAAVFGCLSAGVVAVSAPPPAGVQLDRALPRLRAIAANAHVRGVLSTSGFASLIGGLGGLDAISPEGRPVAWFDVDLLGIGDLPIADLPIGNRLAAEQRAGERPAGERPLGERPAGVPAPGHDDAVPDGLAFLQYTSGSTADPRGVMLSHRNLLANCAAITAAYGTSPESVLFNWLPPYHDMGLLGGILHPVFAGAPCYFTSPVTVIRRPIRWLEGISRLRATFSGGPNFMYDLCVRRARPGDAERLDLSCWQVAVNGAEPVRAATLGSFAETFAAAGFLPSAFAPAYGLAEASLMLSTTGLDGALLQRFDARALRAGRARPGRPGEGTVLLAGCGHPDADDQVVIVDPHTGRRCEDGDVGEIWASGPSVAAGYWRAPEETAAVFGGRLSDEEHAGPFLRTGDLGFLHDGELFVTGRRKETLIINGVNHHPHDIETPAETGEPLLRPHAAAAFTVDDEDGSATRLALVMEVARGRHDQEALDRVIDGIRQRVATATGLRVESVTLVPPRAVPKTTSGKIQRLLSRDLLLAGRFEVVAEWHAGGRAPRAEGIGFGAVTTDPDHQAGPPAAEEGRTR